MYKKNEPEKKVYFKKRKPVKLNLSQSCARHDRLSQVYSDIERNQRKGSEDRKIANTMKKYHEYCYKNQMRNSCFMSRKSKEKLWQTLARKNNLFK